MRNVWGLLLAMNVAAAVATVPAAEVVSPDAKSEAAKAEPGRFSPFKVESKTGAGTVTVNGQTIAYQSVAGTLVVHQKGWDDVPKDPKADKDPADAEASMFYAAYFKQGGGNRPITFLFNGGPGSSTFWLHMGAFGPKRIMAVSDRHLPAAPYEIVNNVGSLLDVSDLVFIDAPGTGFSRIAGKEAEKAFFGVDGDANAFADFITLFLTKYSRWNSPKYIFGESYGTPRAAVLVNLLENDRSVDVNGVILLSQILNFDLSPDGPSANPGIDLPYQTALPTYAATAWYHKKVPGNPASLESFLTDVERFALGDYATALAQGSDLSAAQRTAIAQRLHDYTGLSTEYIEKADLRIDGGEFRQQLKLDDGESTGRLDTRFAGPVLDSLAQRAGYDPQSASISSAYVSGYNDYARRELHWGEDKIFKPSISTYRTWNWQHQQPGSSGAGSSRQGANTMPDLANAMKVNPNLKIQLHAGYYDLATPYFQGVYEMKHLPISKALQSNIEYQFYDSGHMVYAKESSLKVLHDSVADFIRRTSGAHQ